jgi:hypothetical protein
VVVYDKSKNTPKEVLFIIPYVQIGHSKYTYNVLVDIESQLKEYIKSFKGKDRQDINDDDKDKSAKFLALVYFVMILTHMYTYVQLLLARENVKNIKIHDTRIKELETQLISKSQDQEATISNLKEINKLLQDKSNEFEKAYYTLSHVIEGTALED